MNNFTFGWHVDTESLPFERAIPIMRASKADQHLIMVNPGGPFLRAGDIETIRKIVRELPGVKLIIRVFSNFQGDWKRYPSAEEYRRHWAWVTQQLGPELLKWLIFDDPCNEPNLAGANVPEARAYVKRCRDLVKAAHDAGIKLAIGAWSVGTPHESLFETEYLPLMRDVSLYNMAYSYHSYGAIPLEVGELEPWETVLDAVKARQKFSEKRWSLEHPGWLLARPFWIIRLHEKYLLKVPEIYLTECLIDNIFNGSVSHIKDAWADIYGDKALFNGDPRGARSWYRYIDRMFQADGFSFSRALAFIFRHAKHKIFWHPAFKGGATFALNAQWDWNYPGHPQNGAHKEAGSNFDRPEYDYFRNTYIAEINMERIEGIMVSFPSKSDPLWESGVLTAIGKNARVQPDVRAERNVDVDLTAAIAAKRYPIPDESAPDVYKWYAYQIDGHDVWIAETSGISWVKDVVPPKEPRYYVQFDRLALIMTADEIDRHATVYETLALIFREAPLFEEPGGD